MSGADSGESIRDALRPFLLEAEISRHVPADRIYRAAGIGALTIAGERLEENDAEAAALLIETVRFAPAEPFQARAFAILEKAAVNGNPAAIGAVYELALDHQSSKALDTISERKISAPDSAREAAKLLMINDRKRLLKSDPTLSELTRAFLAGNDALRCALLNRAEKQLSGWRALMEWLIAPDDPARRRQLVASFATFGTEERRCFFALMTEYPEAGSRVMADAWLRYDDGELRRLCEIYGAKPSDPEDAAVYYYLIEDWTRYRENDLDYRAVIRAFHQQDKELQLRLIALATRTGSDEWLPALNPDDRLTPSKAEFEIVDWAAQIRAANERNDVKRLWSLAQIAPLALVPDALDALAARGFKPDEGEETALYRRLQSFLGKNPPPYPPTLHASAHHIAGTPLNFQLGADGRFVVMTGVSGKIVVLSRDALTAPILNFRLPGFSPRIAKISHDGKQLVSVWTDRTVRVFDLRTGGLVHQFALSGAETVDFWLKSDGRRLIRLESDGTVRELSFPTGVELSRENVSAGLVIAGGAYDAGKNRLLVIAANGTAIFVDLNRRLPLNRFEIAAPTRFAADMIDRDRLIYAADARLVITHCPSGNSILTKEIAVPASGRLSAAAFVPGCGCALAFSTEGTVFACATSGRADLGKFALPVQSCALARISPDGQYLYVVSDDGQLYQFALHDFRYALIPIDRIDPAELDAPRLSSGLRALLRERIDWDRRFEIDLDFDFE